MQSTRGREVLGFAPSEQLSVNLNAMQNARFWLEAGTHRSHSCDICFSRFVGSYEKMKVLG
jgi:hypothetical protein